ncbi:hypothetical protein ACXDF8_13415 [Mycolicibacterium sp. CBM1]
MTMRYLTPFLIAGAAAAAIAVAPAAQAATTGSQSCSDSGSTSVCQKPGHASIVTSPQDTVGQTMGGPGGLSLTQMWALG